MTKSKDEDERGDNRRQQLVKEEERRVTEELVQFCHHLRQFGLQFLNLNVAGQAPGKCGLDLSTAGGSSGCERSPKKFHFCKSVNSFLCKPV